MQTFTVRLKHALALGNGTREQGAVLGTVGMEDGKPVKLEVAEGVELGELQTAVRNLHQCELDELAEGGERRGESQNEPGPTRPKKKNSPQKNAGGQAAGGTPK